MAAYKTIIPLLRADVDTALRAISLGMFTSNPFRMRAENDRPTQPIAEIAGGTPRLWEMGEPTERNQITLGSPQRKWEYVFPIRVLYPANDPKWLLAVDDDTDRIFDYMTSNNTTVSGVDIREPVFQDYPPEDEYLEEPNWLVRTIPLWTVIEIS
jgi:hypothetical protein